MKRKNLLSGLSNLASTMLIRKIKKGILFTVLVSLCLCLSLSIVLFVGNHNASATTITLTNQGFEDEVESGTIPGWTQAYGTTGVSVTKESAYSLHYSFKMVDTSSTSSVGLESDKVSVVAAQDYKATVMAYVAQGGTSLYIRWYDGSSPPQLISSNYVNSTTTGQWAGVSITATAPANATQAAILLYSSAAAVTTAYFDDVAFYGVIKNAGFETGNTSGWTQAYGTGGLSVVTTNKYSGNYSLKLVDSSSTSSIGLESNKVSVVAAKDYRATVMAYVDNGTASLYIRWYDSSNAWISSNYVNSTTTGQWARMSIAAAAPANATKAAILLYSGAGAVTTAYFDDAEFDEQFINLQKQVTNTIALEGIFTKNASNEDVLYTPLGGTTTKFAEINLNNYTANKKMLLPNAAGAWAMAESSTGKIYTGTYTNGNLYSHTKGSSTVSDLGQAVAGGTNLFDVDAGPNGIVYGGVYSTSGGKIFKYDPSSGFTVLNGGNPLVAGEDYVRSVAYYASTNHLYAGIGSHAYLIKYNLATGTSTNILPSQYSSESFVYSLDIRNGKLFARLSPSSKVLVINLSDNTVDAVIEDVSSLGVSPQSPNNSNLVYYSNGEKKLCYYNMSTKTTGVLNVDLGAGIVEFGYINDGTNNILVGLGAGKVFKYNLSSSAFQLSSLDVYEAPTKLQNIKIAPDGKIYSSGYLAGGIGVYNPTTGQVQLFRGVHQSEGMTSIGDDMYFGVYPGAHIVKNVTTGLWNPVDLFNLHDNGQDRPFGMLGVASEN
ncbi:MAG TPA: carbohydrate binding domain-containing protein, partial [Bacilli bacterium]